MVAGYKAVVIGGSAGSFPVITKILGSINKDFPMPLILCLHRLKHVRHGFVEALSTKSALPIQEPEDKMMLRKGVAYLAPSNYHMFVELGHTFALSTEDMVKFSRPSIDLSFESASYVYKDKLVGIILSGANSDGADGIRTLKRRGGFAIVQDPEEAVIKTMPQSAMKLITPDRVLDTDGIISFLNSLT